MGEGLEEGFGESVGFILRPDFPYKSRGVINSVDSSVGSVPVEGVEEEDGEAAHVSPRRASSLRMARLMKVCTAPGGRRR
jgi:hypothetical protein